MTIMVVPTHAKPAGIHGAYFDHLSALHDVLAIFGLSRITLVINLNPILLARHKGVKVKLSFRSLGVKNVKAVKSRFQSSNESG